MKNIDVAKVVEAVLNDIELDLYYNIHEIDDFCEDPFIGFKLWGNYILADDTGIDTVSPDINQMIKDLQRMGYTVIENAKNVSFKEEDLGALFEK